MAFKFRERGTSFSRNSSVQESVSFDRTVVKATVLLQGFYVVYGNFISRRVNTSQAEISDVSFSANTVNYRITFTFDDGDPNNAGYGTITTLVVAETA